MSGKFIEISNAQGEKFRAYLAVPECGTGPGLVIGQEIFGVNGNMRKTADAYAEEGYVVMVPDLFWRLDKDIDLQYNPADFEKAIAYMNRFDIDKGIQDIQATVRALSARPECTGKVGFAGYCLGGKLAYLVAARIPELSCSISYYGVGLENLLGETPKVPLVFHIAALDSYCPPEAVEKIRTAFKQCNDIEIYVYPEVDHAFARLEPGFYKKQAAQLAWQRTLGFLRRHIGPHYDFSSLWDQHCAYEFSIRDAEATMKTMVAEPYVNHIPTLTGGVGYKALKHFYQNHFIPKSPADTKLLPISRTVGANQIVDEVLFCFTHDIEMDWMLPGIAPTGKYVEIPLVAIVQFRGDKLCHEHIYWDQASVLVQIGKLDPTGLPVAGIETAKKLLDESLPSNQLMAKWNFSE